jgi:hypothetical protein
LEDQPLVLLTNRLLARIITAAFIHQSFTSQAGRKMRLSAWRDDIDIADAQRSLQKM